MEETYPTIAEVESAGTSELKAYYLGLPSPKTQSESRIMNLVIDKLHQANALPHAVVSQFGKDEEDEPEQDVQAEPRVIKLENCHKCKQHRLHVRFEPLFQVYCEVCGSEAGAFEEIHDALKSWNDVQRELAMQLELDLESPNATGGYITTGKSGRDLVEFIKKAAHCAA